MRANLGIWREPMGSIAVKKAIVFEKGAQRGFAKWPRPSLQLSSDR